MNKAVLFLVFNRLDTAKKVFEKIKEVKPKRLYIASDGHRKDVDGEQDKVENVREYVLKNIDWECDVNTLFRETNLGCGIAISQAISWFFEHEKDGIILEDDCVPCESFFYFCEELLDKYKNNKNIWQISGNGFFKDSKTTESYYFSKLPQCWGWATWADRWEKYRFDVSNFDCKKFKNFSKSKEVQEYWKEVLKSLQLGKVDTWDYQWIFVIVENKGYCIDPYNHLVSNIGISGTHINGNSPFLNVNIDEIDKIIHPKKIKYNTRAVDFIYQSLFGIKDKSLHAKLHRFTSKILRVIKNR